MPTTKIEPPASEATLPPSVEYAPTSAPPQSLVREYAESALVTFVMALFFMTFVAQAAEVPTASMENTIYVGDHFLINKFIFAPGPQAPFLPQRDVRRGDVVVFKYPSDLNTSEEVVRYKTLFIKRIVGLPGETIEVRGSNVLINGKALPEYRVTAFDPNLGNDGAELQKLSAPPNPDGYTVYYSPRTTSADSGSARSEMTDFRYAVRGPYRIPAGHYFVMGDNRDNSADSRVWGTLPRELIVGRAMFVIWSTDETAPSTNFFADILNNTRWRRIGTVIR